MAGDGKKNTVEELFEKSNELLEQQVRIPVIFQKLAERGYVPQTEEEAQQLLKMADVMSAKIASGEVAPIPASALEEDGQLSKHASVAAEQDFLHFTPEIVVAPDQVQPEVKQAAAVVSLVGVTGS